MFVTHKREKLINAIIYFVRNTKHCHKLKLFKLLSFLDFEHYRQTGRSVTGLHYDAWPMGPVPSHLDEELKKTGSDLATAVAVFKSRDTGSRLPTIDDFNELDPFMAREAGYARRESAIERFVFKPKKRFNPKFFTKRELCILETVAEIFRDAKGMDMTQVSHLKGQPWYKVFRKGEGKGTSIPYELALSSDPIIQDVPTISRDELEYRDEALHEVRSWTGR